MAFLCQCRRQRKWATSPYTLPSSKTWMKLGSSGNSLSYGLVCSSLREALPNEGAVPGHMETWKSIQELQQIVRELGRRQATFEPASESSDQATFTSGMKARLLHSALSPWYGMLISMLCPVKGQDIYSWTIHCWSGGNWQVLKTDTHYGKDSKQGTQEAKGLYQLWRV